MKLLFFEPHHHKNLNGIKKMCSSLDIELEVSYSLNRLITNFDYDILICNMSYVDPDLIPDNIKIIYGPQHWVFPEGKLVGTLNKKYEKRCVYNTLSKWNENVFLEMVGSLIIPLSQFPFSVDTELFRPDYKEKKIDCILYVKRRSNILVNQIIEMLKNKSISYLIFSYGNYTENDYLTNLRKCKFMISLDAHESQGFALQEAMSCNIPLLVLDVKSMHEETDGINFTYSYLHDKKLLATSVPYWSDECGIKITDINKMSESIDNMILNYKKYEPRNYILNNLSDKICMQKILDYFK